jgi:glutathione S-transferase
MSAEIKLYAPECSTVRVVECSPTSWMVQLALEEKDLPYQLKLLPPLTGKHASPELLAKNPRGTFPVLVDGAIVVYEPFAILDYLEHAHPDPPLLPEARALRALALTRLHESHNLDEVAGRLFSYLANTRGKDLDTAAVDELAAALHDELFFWEYYYGMSHWAAGSELTFADLAVYVHVATAVHLGLPLGEHYPNLQGVLRADAQPAERARTWPTNWKTAAYTFLQGDPEL